MYYYNCLRMFPSIVLMTQRKNQLWHWNSTINKKGQANDYVLYPHYSIRIRTPLLAACGSWWARTDRGGTPDIHAVTLTNTPTNTRFTAN